MTYRVLRRCRHAVARFAVLLRFGLSLPGLVIALGTPAVMSTAAFAETPDALAAHPYAPHVAEAAGRFGIPEIWIWEVMRQESRGNSGAVSPAGARGLMQIMPGTWAMLSARYGLGSDPFDIRANILGGAAYLRLMWDRYGDVSLMLAAYNAGPGRADDYAAGRRRLPAETVRYVSRIAPSLGTSGGASPVAMSALAASSWRQAAIFTARDDSVSRGNVSAADVQSVGPSSATRTPSPVPSNSSQHPLFVPLSGGNE